MLKATKLNYEETQNYTESDGLKPEPHHILPSRSKWSAGRFAAS